MERDQLCVSFICLHFLDYVNKLLPSSGTGHGKNAINSPHHGKRISRAGSVDTLSPCESIASDDLILDYEQSDASSYEEQQQRLILHL